jgi:UDP-glucose 4-epimerase
MIMKDSRILLTGGAGLIGSHIADQLVQEGVREIVVLDNFVRGRIENLAWAQSKGPITVVDGDIRDRGVIEAAMNGIDVVFHLAAIRITQCAQEPRLAVDVLVNGTYNVVEAALKAGVKKLVASSTASVYGLAEHFPTPESHHPYNNRTLYGAAKVFNEGLLRTFHHTSNLDYIALRYFNVYGERMDVHGAYTEVLIRWMERIAAGKAPLIFGDGRQTMDFIHVEDIARANILAAKSSTTDEVFNIANGTETSLNDLLHALLRIMDSPLTPQYAPERLVNNVPRRLADVSKASEHLGFEARITLDEGLRRLVEWWREERGEQ